MSTTTAPAPPSDQTPPGEPQTRPRRTSGALLTALSLLLALLVGAVLVVVSDEDVVAAAQYFFARPQDTLGAAVTAVVEAYSALFQGSVVNLRADTPAAAIRPLTETLLNATPLIAAGLSVALAFRAGLFNIGAEGQILISAACAAYVGFALDLPVVLHLLLALVAALAGGAAWAGIAGFLKARTGAHEVITTIMLNYVARFLVAWLLTTATFLRPGRTDPISPQVADTARLPELFGDLGRTHLGLLLSLGAAAFVWWLLSRSTVGFRFRAVGANAAAARTAGISVERSYTGVMLVAGALAGLAGASQVLGSEGSLTTGISAGLGFDAITVALLGRGSPLGTVLAGLLFGALRAGGLTMQARTGTPIDMVLIVQSLIVLFIAAPPLVRSVFRLRSVSGPSVGQVSKGWNG